MTYLNTLNCKNSFPPTHFILQMSQGGFGLVSLHKRKTVDSKDSNNKEAWGPFQVWEKTHLFVAINREFRCSFPKSDMMQILSVETAPITKKTPIKYVLSLERKFYFVRVWRFSVSPGSTQAGLMPSRRKRQWDTTSWQAAGKDKFSSDSRLFFQCCLGSSSLSGLTGLSMLLGRFEVPKDS